MNPGIILIPKDRLVPLRSVILSAFFKLEFVPESIHLDRGVYSYVGKCSEFDEVDEGSLLPEYRFMPNDGGGFYLERICD